MEDAVAGLREGIREDLNNMHMDVIRQFHLQQVCDYNMLHRFGLAQ